MLTGLKNYYSDYATMGQCYTFVSLGSEGEQPIKIGDRTLRRHYTVANAMRLPFYNELVKNLKIVANSESSRQSIQESQPIDFDKALINGDQSDQINVTIKNYNLEGGMSMRISTTLT